MGMSPLKTPVNRSAPNLAERVSSPTWSPMTIFLAIGPRVLILWGVEFCHFPVSRRSPLTQGWRYRAACDKKRMIVQKWACLPWRPPWIDLHQIWQSGSPRRPNHPRQFFLAIGLGVFILWGVEFCHFPISRRSPLTQCLRYHTACDPWNSRNCNNSVCTICERK